MNNDYLWDRSGEPDPYIENLEKTLVQFRHTSPAPLFSELSSPKQQRRSHSLWSSSIFPRLAFVIGAIIVSIVSIWSAYHWFHNAARSEKFAVTPLQGSPQVGMQAFTTQADLAVGQSLTTDQISRARIHVNNFGDVTVEPNSQVRLLEARSNRKQLALDRGALHARISAPPRQFYVQTASATAVDLGCEYTLAVDDSGAGLIRVTLGWVQFYSGDRQVLVPAGAAATMRPGLGPGTPYFEDVSPAFRKALEELDFGTGNSEARAAALNLVLSEANRQDVLTLFPLLTRVSAIERIRVYDRLASLNPPPLGVTREGILNGDTRELQLWRDNWGLGHPPK